MTIQNAISLADELWPNNYSAALKLGWLSELDGLIFTEIVSRFEGAPDSFEGYASADRSAELLVPYPYAQEIYTCFLRARIDRENGETAAYNASAAHFNAAWQAFADWYTRTHTPKSSGALRF